MGYPNFYAYKLRNESNELSEDEKKVFIEKINELYESPSQVIFRGESKSGLFKRYLTTDFTEFNHKIFCIGNKGKHFHSKQKTIERIDISDLSCFDNIFTWLKDMYQEKNLKTHLQNQINKFKKTNPDFELFFRTETNRKAFVGKIQKLKKEEKIIIRDYYLTILHHNGSSKFYSDSFLLSTTKSFKKAKSFAAIKTKPIPENDKIILMGWVPKVQESSVVKSFEFSVSAKYLNQEKIINKYDLPKCKGSLFPKQHEITLKGGLLAHFLVGYLHLTENKENFYVNPEFLKEKEHWIEEGLTINQKNFSQIMKSTKLRGGFVVYPSGDMSEFKI